MACFRHLWAPRHVNPRIQVVPLVWNYFCKKSELDKVRSAYGQEIEIAGIKMTADVKGQGNKPTIILLPGWGSASPILEFLPLAKALAENFCVITIEPFGYGLSDGNSTEQIGRASCRERV